MGALSEQRKGEALLLLERLLWSLFPIVTVLSFSHVPSLVAFAWTTLCSGIFFAAILVYKGTWREMYNRDLWRYLIWVALSIGVCFYGLYFFGLSKTTPGNAALIALFEVFTSFIFFHVLRKDSITKEHVLGAFFMVLGAVIVLAPSATTFGGGDILILCATLFPPLGNYFQQRAREIASSETIMFMRTLLATPVIFFLAYVFAPQVSFADIWNGLPIFLVNGIFLMGLTKLLWIEVIHRMSVTKAAALGSISPLITLFFAWLILNQAPSALQLLSNIPFILGVLLLTDNVRFGSIRARAS